jgi:hypothetical protein
MKTTRALLRNEFGPRVLRQQNIMSSGYHLTSVQGNVKVSGEARQEDARVTMYAEHNVTLVRV